MFVMRIDLHYICVGLIFNKSQMFVLPLAVMVFYGNKKYVKKNIYDMLEKCPYILMGFNNLRTTYVI